MKLRIEIKKCNEEIKKYKEEIDKYKEENEKMKKTIKEYEEGKIISEKTKSDIDTIKSESLSQIEELKSKINELNANNLNKIKEYKNLITTAKTELDKRNKTLEEYELIALRQEDQIDKLNAHIYELNQAMFKKDLSMKQNENYSNQLINIIKTI